MAWPDLTAARPPGLCAGPGPATRLAVRAPGLPAWLTASSARPRGLFSGRAVCRRSARQAASLMAGRTSGQEATCPSSRRPELGPAAEPPLSSDNPRSAAFPVGLPGVGLRPPCDSQGRAGLPRVLVLALRAWGGLPRLPHPCPGPAPSCWRGRRRIMMAQCPPGGPRPSALSVTHQSTCCLAVSGPRGCCLLTRPWLLRRPRL